MISNLYHNNSEVVLETRQFNALGGLVVSACGSTEKKMVGIVRQQPPAKFWRDPIENEPTQTIAPKSTVKNLKIWQVTFSLKSNTLWHLLNQQKKQVNHLHCRILITPN